MIKIREANKFADCVERQNSDVSVSEADLLLVIQQKKQLVHADRPDLNKEKRKRSHLGSLLNSAGKTQITAQTRRAAQTPFRRSLERNK